MSNDSEIQKKCFVNRRFIQSVIELKKRNPSSRFDQLLKESFEEIINTAENFNKTNIFRSKSYANYFAEENRIIFKKGNPFCMALFSENLSINLVFILLKECREKEYIPILTRGTDGLKESHIVCAFDLFDVSKNESLFRINKQK